MKNSWWVLGSRCLISYLVWFPMVWRDFAQKLEFRCNDIYLQRKTYSMPSKDHSSLAESPLCRGLAANSIIKVKMPRGQMPIRLSVKWHSSHKRLKDVIDFLTCADIINGIMHERAIHLSIPFLYCLSCSGLLEQSQSCFSWEGTHSEQDTNLYYTDKQTPQPHPGCVCVCSPLYITL